MKYCEDHGNALVVFDTSNCPVCEELSEKNTRIEDLEQDLSEQKDNVDKLESALEEERTK